MVQGTPQAPARTPPGYQSGQLQASLLFSSLLVVDFPSFPFLCKPDSTGSLGAGFPVRDTSELIPSLQFPFVSLTSKSNHRCFPFVHFFTCLCLFIYTANSIEKQLVGSQIGKHVGMMTQDVGTLQFSIKGPQLIDHLSPIVDVTKSPMDSFYFLHFLSPKVFKLSPSGIPVFLRTATRMFLFPEAALIGFRIMDSIP